MATSSTDSTHASVAEHGACNDKDCDDDDDCDDAEVATPSCGVDGGDGPNSSKDHRKVTLTWSGKQIRLIRTRPSPQSFAKLPCLPHLPPPARRPQS